MNSIQTFEMFELCKDVETIFRMEMEGVDVGTILRCRNYIFRMENGTV